MTTENNEVWTILGGLHLDLAGEVEAPWFQGSVDSQYWTEWNVQLGGVGGNLARHLAEVGAKSKFLAIVGTDALGPILHQQLADAFPATPTEVLSVEGAATGVVSLLYVKTPEGRTRRLIGPLVSAVDLIDPDQVAAALHVQKSSSSDLILDGYILHRRYSQWLLTLEDLKSLGWRIHLELVPHQSWQYLDLSTATRLISTCASVSSSMGTLERLMNLDPDPVMPATSRANRLLEHVDRNNLTGHTMIYARFGVKDAEYALRLGGGESPRLRRYDPALIFNHGKSTQDRIYVHELMNSERRLGAVDVELSELT
jgi:hypothetical protein